MRLGEAGETFFGTRGERDAAGAKLAFTIGKPAYLIVAIDDLRKLVIAIDPPETKETSPPSMVAAPHSSSGSPHQIVEPVKSGWNS